MTSERFLELMESVLGYLKSDNTIRKEKIEERNKKIKEMLND